VAVEIGCIQCIGSRKRRSCVMSPVVLDRRQRGIELSLGDAGV
jgi:hypothetical protein